MDRITSAKNDSDPSKVGKWEPIKYHFKHLPVHVALLHTGKVVAFGGSGHDETHLNAPHPAEIFEPNQEGKMMEGSLRSRITPLMVTYFVQDMPFFQMAGC